ncbi:TM1802 family CRISPR-associated protein [Arcticibacter sp. MXS-1]|uniref:TM1802 family CRISPR-associated protein n=1 Tax=Arcticibacter sp. MXS-1 TaxID=3341726 RepID=UPI0035A98D08
MQDQAFVEIGKIALEEMGNKEPYQLFIQNMFPDKSNYKMILPVFELKEEDGTYQCCYRDIEVENVNKENYLKYAYRKGAARGGDITFTTKFGDVDKKLKTLVENQFKALLARFSDKSQQEYLLFKEVYDYFLTKESFEQVKAELSSIYDSLPKEEKMSSGLSMLLIVDGHKKYLADFEIIKQILSANGTEDKSKKYNVSSLGKNARCSICLKEKEVVYGFASPFKYSTVDKPGMVSGFFNQANNWKNYPICSECSLHFELGRAYVINNLSSYFYGTAYYIIPKTILSKDSKHLKKALSKLTGLYQDLSKTGIVKRKEDVLEKYIAQEKEDYYNVNLLFYEENPTTKAIKIKLLLEEILPSRFYRLFVAAPSVINDNPLYKKAFFVKKEPQDLVFSVGVLKTFLKMIFTI